MSDPTPSKTDKERDDRMETAVAHSGPNNTSPAIEDLEMHNLTVEQRRVIAEQVHVGGNKPASFFQLFRFHTRLELFLNAIGIVAAIVAGATEPLMTVVFGAVTTQFTNYSRAVEEADSSPEGIARLAEASASLQHELNGEVLLLVYIGLAMFAATWIYTFTWTWTGEKSTRRIRQRYLAAVLRQNVAFFDKMGAGAVTTKIKTDTSLIQAGISEKVSMSCMWISTFVTAIIVAMVVNWRLALVLSVIVPCLAATGVVMDVFMARYKARMLEETATGASLAEEVISSIRNAHAFGTQRKLVALYDVSNLKELALGLKSARAMGFGMAVFFFCIYASYALSFHWGTTLILMGHATAGNIITCFFSIVIGAFSLAELTPSMQAISSALAAASSIFETIDRVPIIDSASPAGLKPETVEGVIELKDVDFIYPSRPTVQVLYKFNAVFPKGKMTALVGGSGSGKSTIIGLLERFYDPVGGSCQLDGIELKDLNVRWLRTQIGLVSQEPTLFATTVAGNIEHGLFGTQYEHESAEEKRRRVVEAATQANADGFIKGLPQGYDTMIGERGMLLSGGQKQRIAIARAIVGNPQILLLDEATSALDTASEAIVQDALDRASTGRTTITIAHRLSTIKDAHQIIVLTAGHILETGMTSEAGTAHENLLRNPDGAYSRLVNAQRFREEEEGDSEASSVVDGKHTVAALGQLSREQLEEMARNEKPQFENLKQTGTGRSAASEALEQKQQRDLEAGVHETKKYSFAYLIRRMLHLNKDHYGEYTAAVVGTLICGCVYPVFAIIFGGIIGVFSLDPETQRNELRSQADRYALYAFIVAVVATVAGLAQFLFFGRTVEHLARQLRLAVFSATLRKDISFFDVEKNSTGHLTSQCADLAQKVAGLMGVTAGTVLQNVFTLVAGSIVGLCYGWKLALVGMACMPLAISAGIVRLRVVVLKDQKNASNYARSAQMACEAAGAIRTVASLTREDDCSRIYSTYLDESMKRAHRSAIFANGLYALAQSLSFWIIGLISWYGSQLLVKGELDARKFFITMMAVVLSAIDAGAMFSYVPDMSKARGAAAEAINLIDAVPEIDAEDPSGKSFDACTGHIRFKDVHFRYPTRPHVRVLRGLDFEVLPGQFVAIVGPSGCGKSTLIQLVERFYDPLSGAVIVDGQDISELNVQSYRKQISLVSQEPTLYAGSVRFNITLGASVPADQVTQEQVEQACRDANIHDFVMSLPDGYDTEVGGKGTQLSGGQKQRVILLLDEATSALDSESEKVVQRALDQAAKGRSTIAVAHRLSTIQAADYVLRNGQVAEKGKHFELLAKKGIYYELVAQQSLEKRE
ncbi:P-loop containing nucleoside triphosphate hydrolase protein [Leucosporidium creatinivorum]|uniref:p-loop containing nucleoside triphosphate hydrolase protein n=1 Tax=Leucosporidium creatinivorum TaxID=106004 RepID=A0A1Y2G8J9_9BASI|nr:P-loop containing nucleoside triphosphate hydrolase protein [Leucosporidium creatinivorum]